MKIKRKRDVVALRILNAIRANDGYCPCKLIKDEATKCMCKEFLEQETVGDCSCGLYTKIEV